MLLSTCVYNFVWTYVFNPLGVHTLSIEFLGHMETMFNTEELPNGFQSGCTVSYFHQQWMNVSVSPHLRCFLNTVFLLCLQNISSCLGRCRSMELNDNLEEMKEMKIKEIIFRLAQHNAGNLSALSLQTFLFDWIWHYQEFYFPAFILPEEKKRNMYFPQLDMEGSNKHKGPLRY